MENSNRPFDEDVFRIGRATVIAVVTTAIVFAVVNRLFMPVAEQVWTAHGVGRWLSHTPLALGAWHEIVGCSLFGIVALVSKKRWLVFLCGFLILAILPVFEQMGMLSGPSDLSWTAMPLHQMRFQLTGYAVYFDMVLLAFLGGHFRIRKLHGLNWTERRNRSAVPGES